MLVGEGDVFEAAVGFVHLDGVLAVVRRAIDGVDLIAVIVGDDNVHIVGSGVVLDRFQAREDDGQVRRVGGTLTLALSRREREVSDDAGIFAGGRINDRFELTAADGHGVERAGAAVVDDGFHDRFAIRRARQRRKIKRERIIDVIDPVEHQRGWLGQLPQIDRARGHFARLRAQWLRPGGLASAARERDRIGACNIHFAQRGGQQCSAG